MSRSPILSRRLRAAGPVAFVVVAVAALWTLHAGDAPEAGVAASDPLVSRRAAVPAHVVHSASVSSAAPSAAASLEAGVAKTDASALASAAENGDLDAQYGLARLLMDCAQFAPMSAAELDSAIVDLGASPLPLLSTLTGQADEQRAVQLLLELREIQARSCAAQSLPPAEQRLPAGREWLDRAAQSGHLRARLDWVQDFRMRWNDPSKVVREGEQVRIERRRAQAYLREAMAARLPEALFAQAIAHDSGDLAALDAVQAQAHWLVWRRLGSPGAEVPPSLLAQGDATRDSRLQPAERQAAELAAAGLLQRFKR
mgnify:CR=1 FL=1